MDDVTAARLNAINRAFYSAQAAAFSASRGGAWPGWQRLWQELSRELPERPRILDVGCGNARLGRFLAERVPGLAYTGLDASPEMLEIARRCGGLGESPELLQLDLVEEDLEARLGPRRFDLVACFGLLHHLPGRARRRALLATLLGRLRPGGCLALTCWQLAQFARFRDRVLAWDALGPGAGALDPAQLEPGDHLLPWDRGRGLRYVHFAHSEETAELLAELGAEIRAEWSADGREGNANRYLLVRPGGAR